MGKPYDNATRFLTSLDALGWARFLGVSANYAELKNADFSTVATQADALIVTDHGESALHVENMTSYDPEILIRLIVYNVLGRKILKLLTRSYLILLRPEADHPKLTGVAREYHADGSLCHEFHYTIVRLWQIPAEEIFKGGLGVIPLAFLGAIDRDQLPDLIHRAEERIRRETTPTQAAEIWTSIDILMGLRYDTGDVTKWLKGARNTMKDSVTYQAIVEEGVEKERQHMVEEFRLKLQRRLESRFGQPDAQAIQLLNSVDSWNTLDDLSEASHFASSWRELFEKVPL